MLHKFRLLPLLFGSLLLAGTASAQINISAEDDEETQRKVRELTWADENELARKAQTVERLGQRHYGQSLRDDLSDLRLLQRIADDRLVEPGNVEDLQALGVVLGNVLAEELDLEWKVYADEKGRSRAVCVPDTEYCLFPLTMLSRRLEVNVPVDVNEVYGGAVAAIEPYLPDQNAYDGKKPDPAERPGWLKDHEKRTRPPIRIRVQ